ncbi:unnamed protein product [Amoebophrya sp. A25]|nr:unnamed protein product [Amoebophrya sp. A25]|eukprot:GSA25T00004199001.1
MGAVAALGIGELLSHKCEKAPNHADLPRQTPREDNEDGTKSNISGTSAGKPNNLSSASTNTKTCSPSSPPVLDLCMLQVVLVEIADPYAIIDVLLQGLARQTLFVARARGGGYDVLYFLTAMAQAAVRSITRMMNDSRKKYIELKASALDAAESGGVQQQKTVGSVGKKKTSKTTSKAVSSYKKQQKRQLDEICVLGSATPDFASGAEAAAQAASRLVAERHAALDLLLKQTLEGNRRITRLWALLEDYLMPAFEQLLTTQEQASTVAAFRGKNTLSVGKLLNGKNNHKMLSTDHFGAHKNSLSSTTRTKTSHSVDAASGANFFRCSQKLVDLSFDFASAFPALALVAIVEANRRLEGVGKDNVTLAKGNSTCFSFEADDAAAGGGGCSTPRKKHRSFAALGGALTVRRTKFEVSRRLPVKVLRILAARALQKRRQNAARAAASSKTITPGLADNVEKERVVKGKGGRAKVNKLLQKKSKDKAGVKKPANTTKNPSKKDAKASKKTLEDSTTAASCNAIQDKQVLQEAEKHKKEGIEDIIRFFSSDTRTEIDLSTGTQKFTVVVEKKEWPTDTVRLQPAERRGRPYGAVLVDNTISSSSSSSTYNSKASTLSSSMNHKSSFMRFVEDEHEEESTFTPDLYPAEALWQTWVQDVLQRNKIGQSANPVAVAAKLCHVVGHLAVRVRMLVDIFREEILDNAAFAEGVSWQDHENSTYDVTGDQLAGQSGTKATSATSSSTSSSFSTSLAVQGLAHQKKDSSNKFLKLTLPKDVSLANHFRYVTERALLNYTKKSQNLLALLLPFIEKCFMSTSGGAPSSSSSSSRSSSAVAAVEVGGPFSSSSSSRSAGDSTTFSSSTAETTSTASSLIRSPAICPQASQMHRAALLALFKFFLVSEEVAQAKLFTILAHVAGDLPSLYTDESTRLLNFEGGLHVLPGSSKKRKRTTGDLPTENEVWKEENPDDGTKAFSSDGPGHAGNTANAQEPGQFEAPHLQAVPLSDQKLEDVPLPAAASPTAGLISKWQPPKLNATARVSRVNGDLALGEIACAGMADLSLRYGHITGPVCDVFLHVMGVVQQKLALLLEQSAEAVDDQHKKATSRANKKKAEMKNAMDGEKSGSLLQVGDDVDLDTEDTPKVVPEKDEQESLDEAGGDDSNIPTSREDKVVKGDGGQEHLRDVLDGLLNLLRHLLFKDFVKPRPHVLAKILDVFSPDAKQLLRDMCHLGDKSRKIYAAFPEVLVRLPCAEASLEKVEFLSDLLLQHVRADKRQNLVANLLQRANTLEIVGADGKLAEDDRDAVKKDQKRQKIKSSIAERQKPGREMIIEDIPGGGGPGLDKNQSHSCSSPCSKTSSGEIAKGRQQLLHIVHALRKLIDDKSILVLYDKIVEKKLLDNTLPNAPRALQVVLRAVEQLLRRKGGKAGRKKKARGGDQGEDEGLPGGESVEDVKRNKLELCAKKLRCMADGTSFDLNALQLEQRGGTGLHSANTSKR